MIRWTAELRHARETRTAPRDALGAVSVCRCTPRCCFPYCTYIARRVLDSKKPLEDQGFF
ncbi:hypothetical protein ACFPRL_01055 [Pseudoclavibacter helvolus]